MNSTPAFRERLHFAIRRIIRTRAVQGTIFHPRLRPALESWPGFKTFYRKWGYVVHPFDREHGTETGGITLWKYQPTSATDPTPKKVYAGSHPSQPSIVRAALRKLPPPADFTFVDLGSGKGRILIVAAEFAYREVIGVEYSIPMSEIAQKNIEIAAQKFPNRARMRIETRDVTTFTYPAGNLVLFLYNPFREELMTKVVAGIEAAWHEEARAIFIVYYNPVCSDCVDRSPLFTRYFAEVFPYAADELGYGPDADDAVVVWQAGTGLAQREGANRRVKITTPIYRADLEA